MSVHTHNCKRTRFGWSAVCVLAVAIVGCRTPSPAWNGSWNLIPSKSNFQGPIFTISISRDGEYRYDDGRSAFTFRCDGKDRPSGENRTRACVQNSPTVLELVQKENGQKKSASRWQLSADGKLLTSTRTDFSPNGAAIANQVVASRISGSGDFAGQWRDPSYLERHADMTLSLDSHKLHLSYPQAGQYIDAPLDGSDVAVLGAHAPIGVTYSVRLLERQKISVLTKRDGKILTQGFLELGEGGRVITEAWWPPGHPGDKNTFVYDRKVDVRP